MSAVEQPRGQPSDDTGTRGRPGSGRGGPRAATLALALTVVLGTALLVAGVDRLARLGAQSLLARSVQDSTGTSSRPSIRVHGAFFLPQVVRGRYDDVEVDLRDLGSGPLRIQSVHADLAGVHLPFHDVLVRTADRVVIDRSTEQAVLTYDDLNRYLALTGRPVQVQPGGAGHVRLSGSVQVLGRMAAASADVRLGTDQGALVVRPVRLQTDTPLDQASELLLGQRFSFRVPLEVLPFGQRLTDVLVRPTGLEIRATGSDVRVTP